MACMSRALLVGLCYSPSLLVLTPRASGLLRPPFLLGGCCAFSGPILLGPYSLGFPPPWTPSLARGLPRMLFRPDSPLPRHVIHVPVFSPSCSLPQAPQKPLHSVVPALAHVPRPRSRHTLLRGLAARGWSSPSRCFAVRSAGFRRPRARRAGVQAAFSGGISWSSSHFSRIRLSLSSSVSWSMSRPLASATSTSKIRGPGRCG